MVVMVISWLRLAGGAVRPDPARGGQDGPTKASADDFERTAGLGPALALSQFAAGGFVPRKARRRVVSASFASAHVDKPLAIAGFLRPGFTFPTLLL
jgi:hypothetical protein